MRAVALLVLALAVAAAQQAPAAPAAPRMVSPVYPDQLGGASPCVGAACSSAVVPPCPAGATCGALPAVAAVPAVAVVAPFAAPSVQFAPVPAPFTTCTTPGGCGTTPSASEVVYDNAAAEVAANRATGPGLVPQGHLMTNVVIEDPKNQVVTQSGAPAAPKVPTPAAPAVGPAPKKRGKRISARRRALAQEVAALETLLATQKADANARRQIAALIKRLGKLLKRVARAEQGNRLSAAAAAAERAKIQALLDRVERLLKQQPKSKTPQAPGAPQAPKSPLQKTPKQEVKSLTHKAVDEAKEVHTLEKELLDEAKSVDKGRNIMPRIAIARERAARIAKRLAKHQQKLAADEAAGVLKPKDVADQRRALQLVLREVARVTKAIAALEKEASKPRAQRKQQQRRQAAPASPAQNQELKAVVAEMTAMRAEFTKMGQELLAQAESVDSRQRGVTARLSKAMKRIVAAEIRLGEIASRVNGDVRANKIPAGQAKTIFVALKELQALVKRTLAAANIVKADNDAKNRELAQRRPAPQPQQQQRPGVPAAPAVARPAAPALTKASPLGGPCPGAGCARQLRIARAQMAKAEDEFEEVRRVAKGVLKSNPILYRRAKRVAKAAKKASKDMKKLVKALDKRKANKAARADRKVRKDSRKMREAATDLDRDPKVHALLTRLGAAKRKFLAASAKVAALEKVHRQATEATKLARASMQLARNVKWVENQLLALAKDVDNKKAVSKKLDTLMKKIHIVINKASKELDVVKKDKKAGYLTPAAAKDELAALNVVKDHLARTLKAATIIKADRVAVKKAKARARETARQRQLIAKLSKEIHAIEAEVKKEALALDAGRPIKKRLALLIIRTVKAGKHLAQAFATVKADSKKGLISKKDTEAEQKTLLSMDEHLKRVIKAAKILEKARHTVPKQQARAKKALKESKKVQAQTAALQKRMRKLEKKLLELAKDTDANKRVHQRLTKLAKKITALAKDASNLHDRVKKDKKKKVLKKSTKKFEKSALKQLAEHLARMLKAVKIIKHDRIALKNKKLHDKEKKKTAKLTKQLAQKVGGIVKGLRDEGLKLNNGQKITKNLKKTVVDIAKSGQLIANEFARIARDQKKGILKPAEVKEQKEALAVLDGHLKAAIKTAKVMNIVNTGGKKALKKLVKKSTHLKKLKDSKKMPKTQKKETLSAAHKTLQLLQYIQNIETMLLAAKQRLDKGTDVKAVRGLLALEKTRIVKAQKNLKDLSARIKDDIKKKLINEQHAKAEREALKLASTHLKKATDELAILEKRIGGKTGPSPKAKAKMTNALVKDAKQIKKIEGAVVAQAKALDKGKKGVVKVAAKKTRAKVADVKQKLLDRLRQIDVNLKLGKITPAQAADERKAVQFMLDKLKKVKKANGIIKATDMKKKLKF